MDPLPAGHPDTKTLAKPRVLIVDDHEETREMYTWCLRAAGWVVEDARDGEEAFFAAVAFQPHVVIMDLRLPVLDGIEATRLLKRDTRTRHIPVVACTGLDQGRARTQAAIAGWDALVQKPCPPDDLRRLLEDLVLRQAQP